MTNAKLKADDATILKKLRALRSKQSQQTVARALGVASRTVRRWEHGDSIPRPHQASGIQNQLELTQPLIEVATDTRFTFIDLFAGIGGIRQSFENIGGGCVFTSEWDSYAQKTYQLNFPKTHEVAGG